MGRVDCTKCENWGAVLSCKYRFRWASNAAGRGVDKPEDVWFCQDYNEAEKEFEGSDDQYK